jgi:hypothetical protein
MYGTDLGAPVGRDSNTASSELQVKTFIKRATQYTYLAVSISKTSLSAVRTRFMLSDKRFSPCSGECSSSINSTCTVDSTLLFGSQFNFLKTPVRTVTVSAGGVIIGSYTLFCHGLASVKEKQPLSVTSTK